MRHVMVVLGWPVGGSNGSSQMTQSCASKPNQKFLKFLPEVPRSAKRLANHLRLLLGVASQRNMLGGSPALEATHLGKWAVLLERWPELGPQYVLILLSLG